MDRGAWWATVSGVTRVRHDLASKQQTNLCVCALSYAQLFVTPWTVSH